MIGCEMMPRELIRLRQLSEYILSCLYLRKDYEMYLRESFLTYRKK